MTVVRWFVRRRGFAVGLSSCGASCGILIVPIIVTLALEKFGWRHCLFGCGAVLLLVTLGAAQFMVGDPAHRGLQPDGDDDPRSGSLLPRRGAAAMSSATFTAARSSRAFWVFVLGYALALLTMTVPFVHIVGFAQDIHVDEVAAAMSISVIGLFSLAGGFGLGSVSDRIGVRAAFALGLLAQLVAYSVLLGADGVGDLYFGAAAFGIYYGSFSALFPALVTMTFGPAHASTIAGVIVGFGGILGAWGPTFAGYLRDVDGDYGRAFSYGLIIAAITIAWFALLRRPREIS
jgi:MFS family permease